MDTIFKMKKSKEILSKMSSIKLHTLLTCIYNITLAYFLLNLLRKGKKYY